MTLSEVCGAVFFEIIWRVPTRGRTAEYKFSYGLKAVVVVSVRHGKERSAALPCLRVIAKWCALSFS